MLSNGLPGKAGAVVIRDFLELLEARLLLAALPGDFNADGLVNAADVDFLAAGVRAGATDPSLDLNHDSTVNPQDVSTMICGILATAPGDANLDGRVDGTDFLAWQRGYMNHQTGLSQGDFNGDGVVDGTDFLIWQRYYLWQRPTNARRIIYVDPSAAGDNNGATWDNALTDLNEALHEAMDGDQIWLAAGTYAGSLDPISASIGIYAAGVDDQWWDWDPTSESFPCTIGNLRFDGASTVTLDGLCFSAGAGGTAVEAAVSQLTVENCKFTDEDRGLVTQGGNIAIQDSLFENNCADGLGAAANLQDGSIFIQDTVFQDNGSPQSTQGALALSGTAFLLGCTFDNNAGAFGAAISNGADLSMYRCQFIDNRVAVASDGCGNAGAVFSYGPLFAYGCEFDNNTADTSGGAIYQGGGRLTIWSSTFSSNLAGQGGAIYSTSTSTDIEDSTFNGNESVGYSFDNTNLMPNRVLAQGWRFSILDQDVTADIESCTFTANQAFDSGSNGDGGAIYDTSQGGTVSDSLFVGNQAWGTDQGYPIRAIGGAVFASNASMINCTFVGNAALGAAEGGIGISEGGAVHGGILINSIVWNNFADSYPNIWEVYATFSDVQGTGGSGTVWNFDLGTDGGGNIDADPRFIASGHWEGHAWVAGTDYRLMAGSPCNDSGNDAYVDDPVDLVGMERLADDPAAPDVGSSNGPDLIVDMGAYEYRRIIYVNASATGQDNGTTWADAFTDLASAVAAAQTGDEIWITAGNYSASQTDNYLQPGVSLYGGFAGGEQGLSQRYGWDTTISYLANWNSDELFDSITFTQSADSPYAALNIESGTGIIINDCNFIDSAYGLEIQNASATLDNCTFDKDGSFSGPNALYTVNSTIEVDDCMFFCNYGGQSADAAASVDGNSTFRNCEFWANSNRAIQASGMLMVIDSYFTGNNVLANDDLEPAGGGAICSAGATTIIDCYFEGNTASAQGGAIYQSGGSLDVVNSRFCLNSAGQGGAIYAGQAGDSQPLVLITGCLFEGNMAWGYADEHGDRPAAGGAILVESAGRGSILEGCTFAGNAAFGASNGGQGTQSQGGAVWGSSSIDIVNCIFWQDRADVGPDMYQSRGVAFCFVAPGMALLRTGIPIGDPI